jgi:DNA polymerase delta subunit 1
MIFKKEQNRFAPVQKATKDEIMKSLTIKLGTYDTYVNEQRETIHKWIGILPKLKGDPIIQIGTTVHRYGERECSYKSIITVGSCDPIEGVEVVACETEREMMLKWRDLIEKLDPDVITGYNIFGFDFWFLYERARELGLEEQFCKLGKTLGRKSEYVEKSLSSSALGDNILKIFDMDGRVLIDIMKVVQRDHKLDSYKLDHVANHFMKMNKHDVSPNDIFSLYKGGSADRKVIAEYCVQDCELCNKLIMKLEILANNIGMSNVCNVPLSYIFMRGQGVKIFSLVSKQCREEEFVIPTLAKSKFNDTEVQQEDEEGYEGAIVLPPQEGIYLEEPVSVLDYASLYPSSMISENLSHDCLVLDAKYDNLPGVEYLDISYDVYDYVDDKKVKVGEKVCRFVQPPNGEKGVIPRILMKLLKARKDTRKKIEYQSVVTQSGEEIVGLLNEKDDVYVLKRIDGTSDTVQKEDVKEIKDTYDEFQKAVLDGLQLAYKVTANSLYGQIGAKTSPIYLKEIAACTTATGRKMICMARDFLEAEYNAKIVYGDTDSVFAVFPNNGIKGRDAIMPSIQAAMEASAKFKSLLKAPHELEYEKTFFPFILFSKKRYCANKYEFDDQKFKQNSMGIALKRRDNAQIVKHIYGGVIDIILNKQDIKESITFLNSSLTDLINGKFPLENLVITKSLKSDYKDPDKIAHKVLAERMGERDPGNKPMVNDRIPFVYIQTPDVKKGTKMLQGDRIEHPEYIKKANLKPDYEFYITNQIMKPVVQLYALTLESLQGYRLGKEHFQNIEKRLIEEKGGDMKKVKDRLQDLREAEVQKILFDPILHRLRNKKSGNREITEFFKLIP